MIMFIAILFLIISNAALYTSLYFAAKWMFFAKPKPFDPSEWTVVYGEPIVMCNPTLEDELAQMLIDEVANSRNDVA
jgi:hypothetical protein